MRVDAQLTMAKPFLVNVPMRQPPGSTGIACRVPCMHAEALAEWHSLSHGLSGREWAALPPGRQVGSQVCACVRGGGSPGVCIPCKRVAACLWIMTHMVGGSKGRRQPRGSCMRAFSPSSQAAVRRKAHEMQQGSACSGVRSRTHAPAHGVKDGRRRRAAVLVVQLEGQALRAGARACACRRGGRGQRWGGARGSGHAQCRPACHPAARCGPDAQLNMLA